MCGYLSIEKEVKEMPHDWAFLSINVFEETLRPEAPRLEEYL